MMRNKITTIAALIALLSSFMFSRNAEKDSTIVRLLINSSRPAPANETIINESIYTEIGKYNSAPVCVSINSQRSVLGAGYEDGSIKLWNIKTGGVIKQFTAHSGAVNAIKFSNNDLLIATGGKDKKVKIWNVASGGLVSNYSLHTGAINCFAFSHNGTMLASGSSDNTINIWSLSKNNLLASLVGHNAPVNSVDFSFNDSKIASAGADSIIKIWNTANWKIMLDIKGHESAVYSAAFFPDGIRVASGGADSVIQISNSNTGEILEKLQGQKSLIRYIFFTMEGNKFISGGYDNTVKIWANEKYGLIKSLKIPGILSGVSPDGSSAALLNGEIINIWNLDSNYQDNVLSGHTGGVSAIACSADGKMIASGSWDKTVKIWDAAGGNLISTFNSHTDGILSLAFSPDGERLASAGFDNTVRVWAVKSGALLYVLRGHTNFVWNVAFSPDGVLIASAGWDNVVKIWETASGRLLKTFSGAGSSIAFSPDGKKLVTGGFGNLKIWDVDRGYVLKDLSNIAGQIITLAYSPDGYKFASGGIDHSIQIWDAGNYTLLKNITGLANTVLSVNFSPDGSKIATGGGFEIDVWDSYSGNLLQNLATDLATVGLKFNNDGKKIIITRDRYIRVYDTQSLLTGKTIRGRILFNNSPLGDVVLTVTGSSNISSLTDNYGYYSFILTNGGSYRLTPSKKGYNFTPPAVDLTTFQNDQTKDFTAAINKINVAGSVYFNSKPLSNVTVNLSIYGEQTVTKTTDQQGKYSFTLDANRTYTLKPVKTGYSFQPQEKTFNTLSENQTLDFYSDQNYSLGTETEETMPAKTSLHQNYPNPFNPSTTIRYSLNKAGNVNIKIYDIFGKEIKILTDKYYEAGNYSLVWQPENISSGVYYCRFSSGSVLQVSKMVYVR